MVPLNLASYIRQIKQLFADSRAAEAAELCQRLCREHPSSSAMLLLASEVYQQLGKFDSMLEVAARAVLVQPAELVSKLRLAEALVFCGQINLARQQLVIVEQLVLSDIRLTQRVAEIYLHCQSHADAHRCYQRAADLGQGSVNPGIVLATTEAAAATTRAAQSLHCFNLATTCVAMGDIDRAEELFNQVIQLNPDDYGAYQNRSMLRTWRADCNHIEPLSRLLTRLPNGHPGEVPLCYALAKEYEDLGEHEPSFSFLRRGAASRRTKLAYQVRSDVETMAHIRQVFDQRLLHNQARVSRSIQSIFVLGLPRSGTTLVDRILDSHSHVESLGEINDLVFSLIRLAGKGESKLNMINQSATLDFSYLGDLYTNSLTSYGRQAPRLIDKTPQNYLYMGLIHLALPDAKIIHLRRHPLDSCYAMYKTLFRMGYPFSYSLEDLGHYYLAYHQLMAHWRETIPESLLDIDYESLVTDQEKASRQLIQYCDLEWEPTCLQFHNNKSAAATASAVQVRSKVYTTSVNRWRAYEQQLAPLAKFLSTNGIDCL